MRFVRIMATAMDAGDAYTHGRAYRCSKYATRVGRRMGLNDAELHHLECAGLLQDLGKKIALHGILQKPAELTQLERAQMNQHTQISAHMLGRISFLTEAAAIVAALNERFDGHGLPSHLLGNEIPISSRILAVVSALDALLSNRPHRRGLSPDAAYAELRKEAGHRFDPKVVDTVIRLHWLGEITADFDTRMAFVYKLPDVGPLSTRQDSTDSAPNEEFDEGGLSEIGLSDELGEGDAETDTVGPLSADAAEVPASTEDAETTESNKDADPSIASVAEDTGEADPQENKHAA